MFTWHVPIEDPYSDTFLSTHISQVHTPGSPILCVYARVPAVTSHLLKPLPPGEQTYTQPPIITCEAARYRSFSHPMALPNTFHQFYEIKTQINS